MLRAAVKPQKLEKKEARSDRLRKRLEESDSDMAADELQAAIERAEAKRRQLKNDYKNDYRTTRK